MLASYSQTATIEESENTMALVYIAMMLPLYLELILTFYMNSRFADSPSKYPEWLLGRVVTI